MTGCALKQKKKHLVHVTVDTCCLVNNTNSPSNKNVLSQVTNNSAQPINLNWLVYRFLFDELSLYSQFAKKLQQYRVKIFIDEKDRDVNVATYKIYSVSDWLRHIYILQTVRRSQWKHIPNTVFKTFARSIRLRNESFSLFFVGTCKSQKPLPKQSCSQ